MTREVVRAFEAWDPNFGMLVIMNRGTVLRVSRILFNREVSPGGPLVERAVEFEAGGALYIAEFDRMQHNTLRVDAAAVQ